jgi:hypothetical protein
MGNLAQISAENWFFLPQTEKDSAQRIADAVSLHLTAANDIMDAVGKWCVFALADGRSPDGNTLYDSKDDALRLVKGNAKDYCYLKITPDGITPKDAYHFLKVNRHPMIDTTAPEHRINPVLMPHMSNLTARQKRAINDEMRRNAGNQ